MTDRHHRASDEDTEQFREAEAARDDVSDEMTPAQAADIRRQIALEVERFEQGMEG